MNIRIVSYLPIGRNTVRQLADSVSINTDYLSIEKKILKQVQDDVLNMTDYGH